MYWGQKLTTPSAQSREDTVHSQCLFFSIIGPYILLNSASFVVIRGEKETQTGSNGVHLKRPLQNDGNCGYITCSTDTGV